MKWKVQILLLIVFAASLYAAEEETMEERKQRIRRKYLRQRADITYSTEEIPETSSEDEDAVASDIFPEAETELETQERMMPPPIRRPPPQKVNRNWLLDTGETEDPYALPGGQEEKEATEQKDWTRWETELKPTPYSDTFGEGGFNRRQNESYSRPSAERSDERTQGRIFGSGNPYGTEEAGVYPQQNTQAVETFGTQQPEETFFYTPQNNSLQRGYGQSTETQPNTLPGSGAQTTAEGYTPYRSPFQSRQEQSSWNSGYTPYKSPYQTQQEHRQQPWGSSYNKTPQEFQRQNSYEQWKQRRTAPVNPMGEDAYIREIMPGSQN